MSSLYGKDFLRDALGLEAAAEVLDVTAEPCNAQGDGFLSTLHRVAVTYAAGSGTKTASLVTKRETNVGELGEVIGSGGFDVQAKEIRFFDEIAPKMAEIFGESEKVVVKAVKVDKTEKVLVLEDLREAAFHMADRTTGLDEVHARLALQKLAKFHAASLKILDGEADAFDAFDMGMFNRKIDGFASTCVRLFDAAADEVATWAGSESFARKMRNQVGRLPENATKCFDVNPSELNVLNHGDLWTTNLMFKYDGGRVVDAVILDFQFCHLGSAALDLVHFLFTSLNDDLYNHRDIERFVQFYFYQLKDAMKHYECRLEKVPSLHQFMVEFHRKLFYGLVYTAAVFPIMISDDPDNQFSVHHADDERARAFRKRVMKTERTARILRKMLPYYDSMGVLDEM